MPPLETDDPIALPYTDVEITESINNLPPQWGQLNSENMFPDKPLGTRYFRLDINDNVITALPVTGEGPPTVARHGSKSSLIFEVPDIEHEDALLAADIESMLALSGNGADAETFAGLFNDRLAIFKQKFDLTNELMKTSALNGVILDGRGSEVLDLYDAFEITQKKVYFDLGNANSNIREKCRLVYQLISEDLSGEVMNGVEARVDMSFFGKLIEHPKVEKYWENTQGFNAMANLARGSQGDYRPQQLEFGNIVFKENPAIIPMWGGTEQPLIPADTGNAYPRGTLNSHVTYVAPPKDIRKLNGGTASLKDKLWVTTEQMKHGRGIEFLGRQRALPIWRRPKVLIKLYAGAGTSTTPRGQ